MIRNVQIFYRAFADAIASIPPDEREGVEPVSAARFDIDIDDTTSVEEILEILFIDTNRYDGALWGFVEPALPDTRSHTALSVGDTVAIDGVEYACEREGWSLVA